MGEERRAAIEAEITTDSLLEDLMKREQAEVNNRQADKEKVPEETKKEKPLTQYEKMKLLKEEREKEAEEQKRLAQPSDAEKMANIYQAMERRGMPKRLQKIK